MAVGLDVGTAFVCSARTDEKGKIKTKFIRDAFLEMPYDQDTKSVLDKLKASYVIANDKLFVIGDNALVIAAAFPNGIIRRPMQSGIVSPEDRDAVLILTELFRSVLGEPQEVGELCCFSMPAKPLGIANFFTEYHEDVVKRILRGLGYKPEAVNEAMCLVYNHLQDDQLSGLCCSFGAGMVNVCHSVLGVPVKTFSIACSGDYIDQQVSFQFKAPIPKVIKLKESGVIDISQPNPSFDNTKSGRMEEAIYFAYRRVIDNFLDNLKLQISPDDFDDNFTIVIAGGTTLVNGFVEYFKQSLEERKISGVKKVVHTGKDAFFSVAKGAALKALAGE